MCCWQCRLMCMYSNFVMVDNDVASISLDLKICEWEWWALQFNGHIHFTNLFHFSLHFYILNNQILLDLL